MENSLVSARISIHALREEGDIRTQPPASGLSYFNPRPPRGGRLFEVVPQQSCRYISIHALREEGDRAIIERRRGVKDFNPRPPRGGRPSACWPWALPARFQSTPSARRATPSARRATFGTVTCQSVDLGGGRRPPRGGRQGRLVKVYPSGGEEGDALREEGDVLRSRIVCHLF